MSNKNIAFNSSNFSKMNALIEATGKPTRQSALAAVLTSATSAKYYRNVSAKQEIDYVSLSNAHKSVVNENSILRGTVHNYRIGFTAMLIALLMAIIL